MSLEWGVLQQLKITIKGFDLGFVFSNMDLDTCDFETFGTGMTQTNSENESNK